MSRASQPSPAGLPHWYVIVLKCKGLKFIFSGGVCGNESSVAILRSLEVGGHAVGVVSHTLSPVAVKEMLTEIVEEGNERDGEETEIYLLDESANIIAAYPNNQVDFD